MLDFLHEKMGMLLVLGAFVALLVFAHHSAAVGSEAKFAEYCMAKSGEAFAAFLGLVTGKALYGNGNGNGKPADPKPAQPGTETK